MTMYTLKDGSQREFDYLVICAQIEYLPNHSFRAPLSNRFIDHGLAKEALKHIQQQVPDAFIVGMVEFEHEMDISRIAERDKVLLSELEEASQ